MNEIHKQRLVGGLILVALGVIFWPIIFVQPDRNTISDIGDIPSKPGVPAAVIRPPSDEGLGFSEPPSLVDDTAILKEVERPLQVGAALDVETSSGQRQPHGPRDVAPEKVKLDDAGIPLAWTLQVATLSSEDAATKLLNELLAEEHKAYITTISRNEKTLYRVCIGPQFEKAQLERLKRGVDKRFDVTSLVARYIP